MNDIIRQVILSLRETGRVIHNVRLFLVICKQSIYHGTPPNPFCTCLLKQGRTNVFLMLYYPS